MLLFLQTCAGKRSSRPSDSFLGSSAQLLESSRGLRVALASGGPGRGARGQNRATRTRAALADPATRSAELLDADPLADYVRKHGGTRVIRKVRNSLLAAR